MSDLLALILIIIMFSFARLVLNEYEKPETKEKQNLIGSTVIIQKDTLEITDYSFWNDSFYLSNGSTIKADYGKTKLIKD